MIYVHIDHGVYYAEQFSEPTVVKPEARDLRKFLNADPDKKKVVHLFTVKNLNHHKLSPVSDPKLLWTISGSKKMKGVLAEPCPADDEAKEELEEAPLDRGGPHQLPPSPGGCPPCASYDPDIAPHSQDQQAVPGCYVFPDPEGYDAFTQAPLDPGPSGTYFVDLPEPPSDLPEPQFTTFTVPPLVSASRSSVLI